MAFDEIRFPVNIGYGSSGGPVYKTEIHETAAGTEERSARWEGARHEWNAAVGVKDNEDLEEVLKFFHAREGANRGFRWKDPGDYNTSSEPWIGGQVAVANDDVEIGTGDGSDTTFQLIKTYNDGNRTKNRTITKPVSGTVLVAINGSAQTEGVDFTVDTTTGIITFSSAPGNTLPITAGFEFDVPVRFGDDDLETNFEAYDAASARIPIIEILEDTTIPTDYNYGGSLDVSLTADRALSVTEARNYFIDADSSGLDATLPDPTNLPPGAPYFHVHNVGSTNAFNLKDDGGTTLLSVGTGTSVTVGLYVEADGTTKGWTAW